MGRVAGGLLSSFFSLVLLYPLDLFRTRIYADYSRGKGANMIYPNGREALSKIISTEGTMKLYRGLNATMFLYTLPMTTFNVLLFDSLRDRIAKPEHSSTLDLLSNYVGLPALAYLVASLAAYPLDTLRKRMQVNGFDNKEASYRHSFQAIFSIFKNEGAKGFYAGIGANTVRISAGFVAQFMTRSVIGL